MAAINGYWAPMWGPYVAPLDAPLGNLVNCFICLESADMEVLLLRIYVCCMNLKRYPLF